MNLPAQVEEAENKANVMLGGQDPQKIEELTKKLADAEHKFKVLQGKYDAEVKAIKSDVNLVNRLKSENKTLKKQVEELTSASNANAEALSELRKQLEKPTKPVEPVLTDADLETLDDEGISPKALELIKKLIPQQDNRLEQRLSEISKKIDTVQEDFTEKNENSWQRELRIQIPDIDNYIGDNADPKFVKWLDSTMRRESLQNALARQDIATLKAGIDLFKKETAEPEPDPNPDDPNNPTDPNLNLENQIEPDETINFDPANIKPDKVWTQAEVKKFYLDQTKGHYVGREKEAAQIDKEIVLALQQGRIK
jgi:DNA repair exonuclease SbcCD ATPase subunit